jgi:hypothetical protein
MTAPPFNLKMRLIPVRAFGMPVVITLLGVLCGPQTFTAVQQPDLPTPIFSSDPRHIWNRLHDCLLLRQSASGAQFGADTVDPLLWDETTHLLTGTSHERALACLDEFLQAHAERLEQAPLKRAVLQHDLWAIFDWASRNQAAPYARRALESRIAVAIRRLALTANEARALPDTYAAAVASHEFPAKYNSSDPQQPFLPADLFRPGGPWVCVSAFLSKPTAVAHFTGRSRFLVLMQMPGGRQTTLAYIQTLRSSLEPPLLKEGGRQVLNLALSQFPAGTQVALVRQAFVIDTEGRLQPTPLTESIQLRVYHAVTPGSRYVNDFNSPSRYDQDFFEFQMSRPRLFAGQAGGLRAVHPGDVEYLTFRTHGDDAFESTDSTNPSSVILETCRACHSEPGIHSVLSRLQWMKPPEQANNNNPIEAETAATITRKQGQQDFQLLQRLWRDAKN